jgi:hypothetical protein
MQITLTTVTLCLPLSGVDRFCVVCTETLLQPFNIFYASKNKLPQGSNYPVAVSHPRTVALLHKQQHSVAPLHKQQHSVAPLHKQQHSVAPLHKQQHSVAPLHKQQHSTPESIMFYYT